MLLIPYRLDFANRPPTSRPRSGTASRPHHFHHVYSPVLHHRASRRWTFCVYCVLPEKNIVDYLEVRAEIIDRSGSDRLTGGKYW